MGLEKLSIIVPVFNEEKTIASILKTLVELELTNNISKEIIVVDDCSTDNTLKEIQGFIAGCPGAEIYCFKEDKNEGKGAALQIGFAKVVGSHIIIQDADLEYNPIEINKLLQPILDGEATVVFGSRFLQNANYRKRFFLHEFGNKFLTKLSNLFSGLNLTDMETCYKLFPREFVENNKLEEKRFGIEPEMTAKIAKMPNLTIKEVPISYNGRNYNEGKKIGITDAIRAIYCILKYN